ncbi:MAG: hypothetical protein O9295_22835, partial [Microcystis sp. LE18-22.4A]|uniref:hypothetical protein n=1 Tax=Microcystis sp. LE18-22.4A TaxID=3016432 RepID=UPI0022C9FE66|nr:hypothetical protein [Microcystis sp. LE18-22.4A]
MSSVVYPDGNQRQFLYESATYPHALTGIVDENGMRWGTFAYDDKGRAVSTELASAISRFRVSYPAEGQALVQDPLGTVRNYSYAFNFGQSAVTSSNL